MEDSKLPLGTDKVVWFDIQSPAEAWWFYPLLNYLSPSCTIVTSRAHGETINILDMHGIMHKPIMKHPGGTKLNKLIHLFIRTARLKSYIQRLTRKKGINIQYHVSHSPYGIVAARKLNIDSIYVLDDPHATFASQIAIPNASKIIMSRAIPVDAITKYGCQKSQIIMFNGIIEYTYVNYYLCNSYLENGLCYQDLGLKSKSYIVIRPPASEAEFTKYGWLHGEKELQCKQLIMRIAKDSTYPIVVLPRYKRQRLAYEKLKSAIGNKLIMPVNPLHGLTLIKHAVAVISFGATMAREAALLGTVGICAFSQKLYTDTYLDDKYNYMHIQNIDDIVNVLKSIAPADAKRCVPRFKMDDWSYRILQLLQTTD